MAKLDKWDLLDFAEQQIYHRWSVNDSGSLLSIHNIKIGLAKVLSVQNYLDYPMDACFIATPDLTPPKGASKWEWGLSAGGLLSWGDGQRPLIFLDPRVSIGSALVGGLHAPVKRNHLIDHIKNARANPVKIRGICAQWDYGKGNHFINIYRTTKSQHTQLPPFVFILHGSAREIKGPSYLGDGLDYQASGPLRQKMKLIDTPLGACRVLTDMDAETFIEEYQNAERFALEKHTAYAKKIFGEFDLISNKIHHGYVNSNKVVLGCYRFAPNDQDLYPITLRSDLPSFLVRRNFKHGNHKKCCLNDRIDDIFSATKLERVIPHGGGVTFPGIKRMVQDCRMQNGSHLVLEAVNGSRVVIENLHSLMSVYRGFEVIECLKKNELAHIVSVLEPIESFML